MISPLYSVNVKTIFGEEQALSRFEGKVLLIVNVASQCGFTRQYSGLQKLYEKYKDRGFRVLAFPCNDFGQQEPGEDKDIKSFCVKNYGIDFNLFSKVKILGSQRSPLYKFLQEYNLKPVSKPGFKAFLMRCATGIFLRIKEGTVPKPRDVKWNFHKFLVDKKGYPAASYSSEIEPDSSILIKRIEYELNK